MEEIAEISTKCCAPFTILIIYIFLYFCVFVFFNAQMYILMEKKFQTQIKNFLPKLFKRSGG